MKYFIFILFSLLQFCFVNSDGVPVLMWKNSNSPHDVLKHNSPALWTMPTQQFEHLLLENLGQENLVIFVQDQLNTEDFSMNEELFSNLQSLPSNKLTFFPSVTNPSSIVASLKSKGVKTAYHSLENANSIPKIRSKVAVVSLPVSKTHVDSRKSTMKIADAVIQKVFAEKNPNTTYIFTGLHSFKTDNSDPLSRRRRDTAEKQNVFKTDCVLLHLQKDMVYYTPSGEYTLPIEKINPTATGECKETNATIKLSIPGVENLNDVTLTFQFQMRPTKRWGFSAVQVQAGSDKGQDLYPPSWLSHMSLNQSYVCASTIFFGGKPNENGKITGRLFMNGFHVQAFTKGITKFGDPLDCVGFFTLPIWTGLLCGIILILILFGGFQMMASLKTMDSFDDAKAKPLVAQNVE